MIRQNDRTCWVLGLAALMVCLTAPLGAQAAPESAPAEQCTAPTSEPALELGLPDPVALACTATANCWNGTTLSCAAATGSCTGVDSSCLTNQQGYVQCGNSWSVCPAFPPFCEDINDGLHGTLCPAVCLVRSDCWLGGCSRIGRTGCVCTE